MIIYGTYHVVVLVKCIRSMFTDFLITGQKMLNRRNTSKNLAGKWGTEFLNTNLTLLLARYSLKLIYVYINVKLIIDIRYLYNILYIVEFEGLHMIE